MAGYSQTPLLKKLGVRAGARMRLVNAPSNYLAALGELPEGARVLRSTRGELDFAHLFADRRVALERALPALVRALAADGSLWISWPKGTSSIATNLNREIVRELGLGAGLVDVKVCAVDDDWSGLKFVYRLKDR